nr:hypothetical protein [Tanacetum cinerariifolium]
MALRSLTQFFYDHIDDYTRMDLDFAADEKLRELSSEEAWEAIENIVQGQKEWDNPPNITSEQELANLKAQAKIFVVFIKSYEKQAGKEKMKNLREKVKTKQKGGFPAQSIRSSDTIALSFPYLLDLIIETSKSRQHESRKSPTVELFDVDSGRISIHHYEY